VGNPPHKLYKTIGAAIAKPQRNNLSASKRASLNASLKTSPAKLRGNADNTTDTRVFSGASSPPKKYGFFPL
jgi:hypothetical protein